MNVAYYFSVSLFDSYFTQLDGLLLLCFVSTWFFVRKWKQWLISEHTRLIQLFFGCDKFWKYIQFSCVAVGELWINKLIFFDFASCFFCSANANVFFFASLFMMFDENRHTSGRQNASIGFLCNSEIWFCCSAHKLRLEKLTWRLLTGRCRSSSLIYAPKKNFIDWAIFAGLSPYR